MDQSAVPYVQKILYLSDSAVNDLVTSKKGEGILKISNEHAAISSISTEDEHRIIKGYYTADPAEKMADKQAITPVKPSGIRELYEDLVREQQVIFEYWLKPDYSAKDLEDAGYKPFQLQRAFDNGTINCWIHSSIINDQHVKNQTKGHYGTVTQIAAYLKEKGFPERTGSP